ncbi:MFS transporter [Sinosporangium siamense]|uniref:MFS transporter n=1 Tax=Sinosporangium siamense TaxID=1367973 RepID=A0A919VBJ1_9ACTN|nr:MFS transporter [Sinosporangium siamense]GII97443.1 hypothetical protein Ssi02_76740 [Sinosporangium siamense]
MRHGLNLRPSGWGARQLNPILTEVSGFSPSVVPLLLIAYGAATVVGNTVVGRLADRHTTPVLIVGLLLNLAFLTGFALLAHVGAVAIVFMLGVGLVGVTMNPAMVVRVQRNGNTGALVNTVHTSFITLGVIVGSSFGGCGSTPTACEHHCGSARFWPPSGCCSSCPSYAAARPLFRANPPRSRSGPRRHDATDRQITINAILS